MIHSIDGIGKYGTKFILVIPFFAFSTKAHLWFATVNSLRMYQAAAPATVNKWSGF